MPWTAVRRDLDGDGAPSGDGYFDAVFEDASHAVADLLANRSRNHLGLFGHCAAARPP